MYTEHSARFPMALGQKSNGNFFGCCWRRSRRQKSFTKTQTFRFKLPTGRKDGTSDWKNSLASN